VDTRADSGNVSGRRLGGNNCGLRSDDCGLTWDVGGNGGLGRHSRYNAQGVGLLKEGSLGSRIDGRLRCCQMADSLPDEMHQELTVRAAGTED
jgi:hypothetical protein